ncbi:methanol/ethanol family PQQ-dependent dehydrogenase [Halomonas heilongjiangensis]|uniref:PQQ-dependent dehydrogenase, methanol/ethanol family n=1 Tax=Halomonas heilongjiangensis TaxID=1387883 RepID=A0A2N7TGV7_9GAMM|nr:methanol/ethanol family PQQ-dependent dehydrogenase [Halomonas heilongjiangensis]PMR67399.1 PQQ-dependent dehydrogenase, methanol/ethanol family [Halomonas heilongjiangensis]PXX91157.1 PQQ-dependent dehydrogenase, methanol/ethanol family [Halomonas heilongjiangensis]
MLREIGFAMTAAGLMAASLAHANQNQLELQQNPEYWATQLGNYQGNRYSELDQINRDNVGELRSLWQFSTGVLRGHEGGPLYVGDGRLYIHTPFPNKVFALDLEDEGRVVWSYEPDQDSRVIPVMCCDTVNRGLAYADGRLFLGQADNTLIALDAETGELLWDVSNGDHTVGETNTMSPLVVHDKVIVGISGGEYGIRGHMTAYDVETGEQVWRGYSTGPDDEVLIDPETTTMLGEPIGESDLGVSTWPEGEWERGGGAPWGWITYDPDLDLIYYGTGNPGTWNPEQRTKDGEPADNKWAITVFARDPNDGSVKWVYQKVPFDEWDYDGVNENQLIDVEMNGEQRKGLAIIDRTGFGFLLDRENGELLVAEKFAPETNWADDYDMETGRPNVNEEFSTYRQGVGVNTTDICPTAMGAKNMQPSAYSPKTGLIYAGINRICMNYEPFEAEYVAGQPYVGATLTMMPSPMENGGMEGRMGSFIAWDPVAGETIWEVDERFAVWSGALATAGDLAFYGTLEGHVKAVDIETGEELWRFKTPSGIIGNVNTFMYEGKQHVAVLSGVGGWAGIGLAAGLEEPEEGLGAVSAFAALGDYTKLGGVLTVFALPD